MITVDHVYPNQLTGIVGPSGTIRRILSNRDFFLKEGLDISVFNHGRFYRQWDNQSGYANFASVSGSVKHRIRQRLDSWARHSLWLSIALLSYKRYTYKKVVVHYLSHRRQSDVVVFHSETEAYFFLKKRGNCTSRTACFFHSDGIPLQMFYIYYPKLEGSRYANRLMNKFRYVVENVDKCVFICKKGQENLNRLFPGSINKSFLVVNGIDDLNPEQLQEIREIKSSRTDNLLKLVSVGSVSIRKGQRLVLEALNMLSEEKRDRVRLSIIGTGPDFDYCRDYVNRQSLSDIVTFTGAIPNVEVYRYLAGADVFVLMSNNEGLPISIIEAMRAGLAILSTNVSGIPELVGNNNGVLINVSSQALYQVLDEACSYDWTEMGKASRSFFEQQFTFERMRRDYIELIHSLTDTDSL